MNATTQTVDDIIASFRRRHFIIPDREDLLIISEMFRGDKAQTRCFVRTFGSEAFGMANYGCMSEASKIADHLDGSETQFFRFDCETNQVCEDVTDEIYAAWLADADLLDIAESGCWPAFVPENDRDRLTEEAQQDAADWAKGPSFYYGVPAR